MSLSGNKELHYFDRFLHQEFTDEDASRYPAYEFTPGYLRWPWVPELAKRACPDALLIVILRDPVERFFSAMRWRDVPGERGASLRPDMAATDAVWGGMYARHLATWTASFPREQIHVEQYERAVEDPGAAAERVWRMVGLDPVPLGNVSAPSPTTTTSRNHWNRMRETLQALYRPDVDALADWGVERERWSNFDQEPPRAR